MQLIFAPVHKGASRIHVHSSVLFIFSMLCEFLSRCLPFAIIFVMVIKVLFC